MALSAKVPGIIAAASALALTVLYAPWLPYLASAMAGGRIVEAVRTPYIFAIPLALVAVWLLLRLTKPTPAVVMGLLFAILIAFTLVNGFSFGPGVFLPLQLLYPLDPVTIVISAIGLGSAGLSSNIAAVSDRKSRVK